MPSTTQRIQLAIKAAPEEVWNALVDGAVTPAYYIGFEAHYELEPGRPYRYTVDGTDVITGEIIAVDPGRRLRSTFNGHWAPDVDALPESTVEFSLFEPFMQMPGVTFLSCVHEGLPNTEPAAHLEIGWVSILSGLKTLLEAARRSPLHRSRTPRRSDPSSTAEDALVRPRRPGQPRLSDPAG